ncbi:hypothetical protein [Salinimicrobium xinjiangense]|uniref:hypothetical protein n=1 Tax=Salinimicrobium xinjiangense TaxID=438596 RepID=UPI0003FE2119|nr:hypothetical protein [Salinimicrobium xinjiangense]
MTMVEGYILFFTFFGALYLVTFIKRKKNLRKAKKAFIQMHQALDRYEMDILNSFDEYLLHHKVLKYNNENETLKSFKTEKYVNADIQEAFEEVRRKLLEKMDEKVYDYGNRKKTGFLYNKFVSVFLNSGGTEKIYFLNEELEEFSTQVAIENYTYKENPVALGGEYIALWVYKSKLKYNGQGYPEGTWKNLKRGRKRRLESSEKSNSAFWADIQAMGF